MLRTGCFSPSGHISPVAFLSKWTAARLRPRVSASTPIQPARLLASVYGPRASRSAANGARNSARSVARLSKGVAMARSDSHRFRPGQGNRRPESIGVAVSGRAKTVSGRAKTGRAKTVSGRAKTVSGLVARRPSLVARREEKTVSGRAKRRVAVSGRAKSRRLWSREEKLRIVAESLEPGASVSRVARRHDVNANLVFTWRRLVRDGCLSDGEVADTAPRVLVFAIPQVHDLMHSLWRAQKPGVNSAAGELRSPSSASFR